MRHILSRLRRAVEDYQMIQEGDRIAVGVSGGKDSMTALAAMKRLQSFYPKPFHLEAVTLDMGFDGMDFSRVETFCRLLDVPYTIEKTDIAKIVFDYRKEKNPCALCANLRRGALMNLMNRLGLNKIVYGHHFDDVVETYFLSLLFEGRMHCFSPVTHLTRRDVTVLRPMIYIEEKSIKKYTKEAALPVVKSTCPADSGTKRQYVKELLAGLEREHHGLKQRVFTAIVRSGLDGWGPPEAGKSQTGHEN